MGNLYDYEYDGRHKVTFYKNIGGSALFSTWDSTNGIKLIPTSPLFVAPPEQKRNVLEVPGRDGVIDFTYALRPYSIYNNRSGSWSFMIVDMFKSNGNSMNTVEMISRLMSIFNGRDMYFVLSDDPDYYYHGNLMVSDISVSTDGTPNGITIDYDVEPYKTKGSMYFVVPAGSYSGGSPLILNADILGKKPCYIYGKYNITEWSGGTDIRFVNSEIDPDISGNFSFNGQTYKLAERSSDKQKLLVTNNSGFNSILIGSQYELSIRIDGGYL